MRLIARPVVLLAVIALCACGASTPPQAATNTPPLVVPSAEGIPAATLVPDQSMPSPDEASLPWLHENATVVLPVGLKLHKVPDEDPANITGTLIEATGAKVSRIETNGYAVVFLAKGEHPSAYVRVADLNQSTRQLVNPPPDWFGKKVTNYSGQDVNVRPDPSTANAAIASLGANETVIIIDKKQQNDGIWYKIHKLDKAEGWVREDALAAP